MRPEATGPPLRPRKEVAEGASNFVRGGTETERYMRVTCDRYCQLRTHDWDDAIIDRLRKEQR